MRIPNASRYDISESGTIVDLTTSTTILVSQNANYKVCNLTMDNGEYKLCYLHRLLAETFLPNPQNKPVVNHIDSNKLNNNLNNLEWSTHKDNIRHSLLSKGISEFVSCEHCGAEIFKSKQSGKKFCSKLCYNLHSRLSNIDKFMDLGEEFIVWCIQKYPYTYLAKLVGCSDNGLRRRIKLQINVPIKVSKYSEVRPSTLIELYNKYKAECSNQTGSTIFIVA